MKTVSVNEKSASSFIRSIAVREAEKVWTSE
jgi:hypothetical protein